MPKYRVLAKSFIDNFLREEGDEVDYEGEPGTNLELVEEAEGDEPKAKPKAKGAAQKAAGQPDASADLT